MIILIDNYDSFVYNLYHLIKSVSDQEIVVYRNDKITLYDIQKKSPNYIFISPGPCTPNEAGVCIDLIKEFSGKIPIFGVCLGFQAIISAFGGKIIKNTPMHGKVDKITHDSKSNLLKNIPNNFEVVRYHSLVGEKDSYPNCMDVSSYSSDGAIMSGSHKTYKTAGVQFHPESILSTYGKKIIQNFFNWADDIAS